MPKRTLASLLAASLVTGSVPSSAQVGRSGPAATAAPAQPVAPVQLPSLDAGTPLDPTPTSDPSAIGPLNLARPDLSAASTIPPAVTLHAAAQTTFAIAPSQPSELPLQTSITPQEPTALHAVTGPWGSPAEAAPEPARETVLGGLSQLESGARRADAPAALRRAFDASADVPAGADAPGVDAPAPEEEPALPQLTPGGVQDATRALFRLRRDVQSAGRGILLTDLGGDVGDGVLHHDVERVLRRLLRAAGYPPEAAQVFIGSSFLPNAFTTIVPPEAIFLEQHASLAKAFRISNVFLSLGLLRAVKNETQLAFVLAHELMHNWKSHLKDFTGTSYATLGHFHEFEADSEALKLVAAAGYDPRGAVDTLYALHDEYDRLEKEYTYLKHDNGEVAQALQRLRDIHPHPDIRRANMLDHMNEALELYEPAPVPADPAWMRRRSSAERPTRLDRFEARLKAAVQGQTVEESLRTLESFVENAEMNEGLSQEEYAIIENAYRRLLARPDAEASLRPIELSLEREEEKDEFPSPRLKASLITRQLGRTVGKAREAAGAQPEAAPAQDGRRAQLLALVRGVKDRPGLEAALAAVSARASELSLDPKKHDDRALMQAVSVRLWRAARRAQAQPQGAAEIHKELAGKLPPAWARLLRDAAASEPFTEAANAFLRDSSPGWEKLLSASESLEPKALRSAARRLLSEIRDRAGLEAAYAAVGREPARLGLELGKRLSPHAVRFALGLWRAAARVQASEKGSPATPEEVRAELDRSLPPSWRDLTAKAASADARAQERAVARLPVGRATLKDYLRASSRLSAQARLAGTLRFLGAIRTRRQLDLAFRTLSREAETLGLDIKRLFDNDYPHGGDGEGPEVLGAAARHLWGATRRVLTAELGRPALPEEIVDELAQKLSPSWLKFYRDSFNTEIIESAFGPAEFRSRKYRPSQLAARLRGQLKSFSRKDPWTEDPLPGFSRWQERHHNLPDLELDGRNVIFQYERFHLERLSSASLEDQVDIFLWFRQQDVMFPAFVELLRREGKLMDFLGAAHEALAKELRTRLKGAATLEERRWDMDWYHEQVLFLLGSSLYGLREFKPIRETVEAFWSKVETLLDSPEINASFSASNRSVLASGFFKQMGLALRQAVVGTDLRGARPDREEILRVSALVRRIESRLRAFPSTELVKAHARRLGTRLGRDRSYLLAYHRAMPWAVELRSPWRISLDKWLETHHGKNGLATIAIGVLKLVLAVFDWARLKLAKLRRKIAPDRLPGVPAKAERSLTAEDFAHFLALIGDPDTDARTKLMAVALLDRLDLKQRDDDFGFGDFEFGEDALGKDVLGRAIGMRAAASAGRWLLEDAVQSAPDAELGDLSRDMLRLSDLHPGLLQPDLKAQGNLRNAFRDGASLIKRNEAYRSLAKGEHPFRGVNTRWALDLASRLDAAKAWPRKASDRLDLLDFLNSNGEFSDALDERVIALSQEAPKAFRAWMRQDAKRLKRLTRAKTDDEIEDEEGNPAIETPFGSVPVFAARALRIVRNPALRTRLFDALPEARLRERAPRRSPWEWLKSRWRLLKAYWAAREYFSAAFLRELQGEGSLEDKFFEVIEEVDRVAAERAKEAGERWEKGEFTEQENVFLKSKSNALLNGEKDWKTLLPHEKEDLIRAYKERIKAKALAVLLELYNAYAGTQDPVLGLILDNYPEPTRSRDDLLERLIKARRLTPGGLSFLEAHKSYRMPNPVRIVEKQLLDQAVIQLRKFSPEEKVDILLHLAKIERLDKEKERAFNRRVLSGDRRKLSRDYAALRSVSQLENYLSLLHPKDKALLIRAMFYGEHSLHQSPEQVKRLYERLVIAGRNMPPFLQKVFRAYFRVMNDDEKARIISDIAALEDVGPALKGPDIAAVALRGAGVTGAKIAQALATHRGLVSREYARRFEEFKESAQKMEKMRAFGLISDRMSKLEDPFKAPARRAGLRRLLDRVLPARWRSAPPAPPPGALGWEELEALSYEALPKDAGKDYRTNIPLRRRLIKQVRFLLREQTRRIRWVEFMGPELGAGSIKLVYKIVLDDGRTWVAKLRAPGAVYKTRREFELIEGLISEMEAAGDLDLPGARQLLDEVKDLVRAEMDFRAESAKERGTLERAATRPWYARLFAPRPYVPRPHRVYVSEDLMIEEYVPTTRFKDLPRRSLIGPSQGKIARRAVREGMFSLVFDEWLEPDPHSGNRHARAGWLHRFWTRMVLMDLGQGKPQPIEDLKPLMRAALALDGGDAKGAARALSSIVSVPPKHTPEEVLAAMELGFKRHPDSGLVERLMDALLEAEKPELGALVLPAYAPLEKAFILYAGYAPYLPKDYVFKSLERAAMARLWRDRPVSRWRLLKLGLRRALFGRAAVRAEVEALIEGLRTRRSEVDPSLTVEGPLGEGGIGKVLRVKDQSGRTLALKIAHDGFRSAGIGFGGPELEMAVRGRGLLPAPVAAYRQVDGAWRRFPFDPRTGVLLDPESGARLEGVVPDAILMEYLGGPGVEPIETAVARGRLPPKRLESLISGLYDQLHARGLVYWDQRLEGNLVVVWGKDGPSLRVRDLGAVVPAGAIEELALPQLSAAVSEMAARRR